MTDAVHPPIKLFQFPRMFGIPNVSPFCCKLETWLRIAKVPYEVVDTPDPRKGPKGKLPFIEDGGVRIADSSLIVDYLVKTRVSEFPTSWALMAASKAWNARRGIALPLCEWPSASV
jgi:glutathione S-transferase